MFINSRLKAIYIILQREAFYRQINPFVSNAPFFCPLKTSEKLTVFSCFQGLEKEIIGKEWVNLS